MKIIIVTQYFWPENFRVNDLALGLKELGHEITVLTGMPNYPEGKLYDGYSGFAPMKEEYQGIKIIRAPLISRGNSRAMRLALNYVSYALSASILGPLLCREKYDLVFVSQYSPIFMALPAIVLKKIKGIPLLMWVQDLWPESLSATGAVKSPAVLGYVDKVVSFIYKQCDKILVQSKGFIESVENHAIPRSRIIYWPNWAEKLYNSDVNTTQHHDALNQLPKGFRIMFAGNIGAAQDFETIVEAAEKLKEFPDIHFIILGDGRMKPWVVEEVKKRGLDNLYLLGRHPINSMPVFFAGADVMLVTLKREEIFALTIPGKVQSYMACAKPIIACLEGEGARVIRESEAGIVCQPEDSDSLVSAILQMYRMRPEERSILGLNSRKYYENNFERDRLIEQFNDIIEEIKTNWRK